MNNISPITSNDAINNIEKHAMTGLITLKRVRKKNTNVMLIYIMFGILNSGYPTKPIRFNKQPIIIVMVVVCSANVL